MSALSVAASRWLAGYETTPQVSVIDGGIAASRRTGIAHHVADAAEITVEGETTLAARWLCGGSSIDAVGLTNISVACVGCRIAAAVPQGPCVYYAWDEDDDLLYVGSSINLAQRIRGHRSRTHWWPEVRRLTFEEYPTEHEARRAEMEAIAERPGRHNREGVFRRSPVTPLGLVVGGEEL